MSDARPFLYPERGHDYDPAHDYQRDRQPDPDLQAVAERVRDDLTRTLLPRLGVFAGFDVYFARGLGHHLGRYVDGTVSHPVVVLSLSAIRDACDEHELPYDLGVETTITHELAHALQEAAELPPDERQAEAFARAWWERRELVHPELAAPSGGERSPQSPTRRTHRKGRGR